MLPSQLVDIGVGDVIALPVGPTAVDVTPLTSDGILMGWSLRESAGEAPANGEGSVTSPAAGATIAATPALAAGTYTVNWVVSLAGTLAAADANNFQLRHGTTAVVNSVNLAVAGEYLQAQAQVTVAQGETINVIAIALATVGAIYTAQIDATVSLSVGADVELQDVNSPLGEIGLLTSDGETEWFGPFGVRIYGQIKVHVISGQVTGVIYAALIR